MNIMFNAIRKDTWKKGFTLIELLVVIAIIGILSSVVLASLNTARGKGNDASIRANINSTRAQAELFYDNNASKYSTDTTVLASAACPTAGNTMFNADPTIKAAIENARNSNGGTLANVTRCAIGVNGQSYALAVQLKTTTDWVCVDSTGNSKTLTGPTAPALAGNTVAAVCP